jgi:hypothetical protein
VERSAVDVDFLRAAPDLDPSCAGTPEVDEHPAERGNEQSRGDVLRGAGRRDERKGHPGRDENPEQQWGASTFSAH